MDNKHIVMIMVAILIVAAGTSAIVMSLDEEDEKVIETGRLVIYGNANNDDYLDSRDVDHIRSIVNGDVQWDQENYPFADTNTDGKVDADDIALLEKFLKKESATMYYYDYAGTTQSIHYPISGKLSVIYNYGLDASIILGCYDRVVGASNNVLTTASNTESRYPGLHDKVNVGDPVNDPETFVRIAEDNGIKALFGIGEAYVTTVQNSLRNSGSDIDVITINTSGYKGVSCDYLGGLITLGVMFGCEEKAYEYISYADSILNSLDAALSGAPQYTYVVPHNPNNTSTVSIRTTGSDGSQAGNVHTINMLPLTDLFEGKQASSGTTANIEDIGTMDPDIINISTCNKNNDSMTYDEAQSEFEAMAEYFQICEAYKEKRVFCATFESFGTYSGIGGLYLLASFIWPDLVDEDRGWEILQEYYDRFTFLDVDVKEVGCFAVHKL